MSLRQLLLAGLLSLGAVISAAAESLNSPPTWVIDPAVAGNNLPTIGRSLFDQIFAVDRSNGAVIALPFPFAALLNQLDSQLAREPGGTLPPAKRVLIPLGRSLQRTAAAPDYFRYPRVVVVVDAEPISAAAPFIKDRLYLGYQEKSAVLEVISYNEAAGRFEFQLVKDYRAGGQPKVFYANRNLCFACHQNGAPIFSRALWDETNANPQIAAQLAASGKNFYGIPPERGVDIPYAIDNATGRANGFALTQRLWQEGCGAADLDARRCRAGLFTAALRHALADGQRWLPDANFEQNVSATIRREARRRWPGGLAVGNPDLPNRNPLQGLNGWPDDNAARVARSHVAANFEPLAPRPAKDIWQAEAPDALATLVAGLAKFISSADRRRLEIALTQQENMVTKQLSAPCQINAKLPTSRWSVQCAPLPGQAGPTLSGSLSLTAGRPNAGQLSRLTLPDGTTLNHLELALTDKATASSAAFTPHSDNGLPHTAEGQRISRLTFQRNKTDPNAGEVVLEIHQEFAAVDRAIKAIIASPAGENLFGPGAFPRSALLAAVFQQLGAPMPKPCCQAALALPAAQLEVPAMTPSSPASQPLAASLQGFYPYCATCHQTAEHFPPNFLTGNGAQVAAQLRHCAPRLYIRLAMADLPPEQRTKTPMPPESMLPAFAIHVADWRASPARAALLSQVSNWLQNENGQPPNLPQLLANGYEALRPCLPAP